MKRTAVLLTFCLSSLTALANHECDEKFDSSSGAACKFVKTVVKVDTARSGKDIWNLPTDVVVKAFSFVPYVGYVVEDAYEKESNYVYKTHIKPPPTHSNYVYCWTNVNYRSINPQRGPNRVVFGWTYHGNDMGTFAWRLRRSNTWFGPGTSFKADIIWTAVHPEYVQTARNEGSCDANPPRGNLKAPF